ncbi:unnamed protein product [Bursaphelenchus xylophilus]|uniref:(pine wood nematode) hypothetical protein n=1 Tax=Bursaphelenchus xylophilus TaxID=6326 RepID=A0A7I8XP07_BURXY|nr:unnamed protein product [Bursaphelenchus xylophilus]CAG9086811.1 unnamed protein product [Bursaphelenchus xylophilus]
MLVKSPMCKVSEKVHAARNQVIQQDSDKKNEDKGQEQTSITSIHGRDELPTPWNLSNANLTQSVHSLNWYKWEGPVNGHEHKVMTPTWPWMGEHDPSRC